MSNPAFIVDGYTEKKLVQEICPGQPVRRTDLNGKYATIKAIAKKIASLIRALGNKHYPIIILVDKEARNIQVQDMADQLKEAIQSEGLNDHDIRIGVADRMTENWILADWEALAGNKKKPSCVEGVNGASVIRKIKGSYDKTTDCVEYFKTARQSEIYKNSPSYRYFINQLNGIKCNYLNFNKQAINDF